MAFSLMPRKQYGKSAVFMKEETAGSNIFAGLLVNLKEVFINQ